MSDPFKTFMYASDEKFSAPYCSVVAVSGSVEADTKHSLLQFAFFGQNRSHVRPMMLHCQLFSRWDRHRMLGGSILRVRIVRHQQIVGVNGVHGQKIANGFFERTPRLIVIEIADVLANERLAIDHQCDGIFQVCAQGEHRPFYLESVTAPGA